MATYIIVEGIDGSGKSTVATAIARRIKRLFKLEPLELCEPQRAPGTIGAEIRRRLVDGPPIKSWEAVGLFNADRVHQLQNNLRPALDAGRIVVQDRSYISTAVYNGDWRGVNRSVTHMIGTPVWPDAEFILHHHHAFMPPPDLLILLDLPGVVASARTLQKSLRSGVKTNMPDDVRSLEDWRIRYRKLIQSHIGDSWWRRLEIVDAARPKRDVIDSAWAMVVPLLGGTSVPLEPV